MNKVRRIDSTKKDIPENVTQEELMEDQHRPITKEEKAVSEKILKEYKRGNAK